MIIFREIKEVFTEIMLKTRFYVKSPISRTFPCLISASNCLPQQDHFSVNPQQSFEGQNSGENSGLGDWSFDNLDEIVAVAIKAEFHTMDLAELGK